MSVLGVSKFWLKGKWNFALADDLFLNLRIPKDRECYLIAKDFVVHISCDLLRKMYFFSKADVVVVEKHLLHLFELDLVVKLLGQFYHSFQNRDIIFDHFALRVFFFFSFDNIKIHARLGLIINLRRAVSQVSGEYLRIVRA